MNDPKTKGIIGIVMGRIITRDDAPLESHTMNIALTGRRMIEIHTCCEAALAASCMTVSEKAPIVLKARRGERRG